MINSVREVEDCFLQNNKNNSDQNSCYQSSCSDDDTSAVGNKTKQNQQKANIPVKKISSEKHPLHQIQQQPYYQQQKVKHYKEHPPQHLSGQQKHSVKLPRSSDKTAGNISHNNAISATTNNHRKNLKLRQPNMDHDYR